MTAKQENFCFLLSFLFVIFISSVNADCYLMLKDQKPLLMQNFGSRKMLLSKTHGQVELKPDETIQAACARGSSLYTEYNEWYRLEPPIQFVEFQCIQDNLLYRRLENSSLVYMRSNSATVGCVNETKILYESTQSLPNCEKFMSYGVGSVSESIRVGKRKHSQSMSAAMCYDLDNLSLKYVTYLGYRPLYNVSGQELTLHAFSNFNFKAIKEDSKLFLQFLSQSTFNATYARKKCIHPLLAIHDFDFVNIIQDESLRSELYAYEEMFNVIWWRNLRLGNWRLLLKAVKARSQIINYKIYTGVDGNMLMPPIDDCEKHRNFSFAAEEITVAAPAYIWLYMEPLDNTQAYHEQQYVFIGYNSPFYIEGQTKQFCTDVCHEIDWLRQSLLNVTHLMPTFGILHCCRIADVMAKLQGFPLKASEKENEHRLHLNDNADMNVNTLAPSTTTSIAYLSRLNKQDALINSSSLNASLNASDGKSLKTIDELDDDYWLV